MSRPVRTVKKQGDIDVRKLHDLNPSSHQKKGRSVEMPVHYGVPDEVYKDLKKKARDDILKKKTQSNVININLSAINKNAYNKSDKNNQSSIL